LQWLRSYYAYIDYALILSSSILAELIYQVSCLH